MPLGLWTRADDRERQLAEAQERRRKGLKQLVSQLIGQKVDHHVASLIGGFLNFRCMLCDERPGIFTKIGNICEWRCMDCFVGLSTDRVSTAYRSIHHHVDSSARSGPSSGVSSSDTTLSLEWIVRTERSLGNITGSNKDTSQWEGKESEHPCFQLAPYRWPWLTA